MAEEVVQDRTMFHILLMAGSIVLHHLNMIRIFELLRRSRQMLMWSDLYSFVKRLIISIVLSDKGNAIGKPVTCKDYIKPQIGYKQVFAKAKATPVLKMHPEINMKESHHTFPICMDSGIDILNLPQFCGCDFKSEMQDHFVYSRMMGNTTKHFFQNDETKSEPSDNISCDYFKNNPSSVALTTDSKTMISSSITISTSENKMESVQFSVVNTVSLSSWTIRDFQQMPEATEKLLREDNLTVPPWGDKTSFDSLLPVSDCIYDNQGRLIYMTVHLVSAESCISSSCGATEDFFELNWQSDEEKDADDAADSSDYDICCNDDCFSDDSDICIAFEDLGKDSCQLSVYLETPICGINNNSQDVFCNNFDEKTDFNTSRKRVSFKSDLTEVHQIVAWKFAYHAARKGPWERAAADRAHFKQRIMEVETILAPTLQKQLNNLLSQRTFF